MTPMLLLLLFPFLVIVGSKIWNAKNFSWLEAGAQALLSVLLIVGGYQAGKHLEMTSVEFWTGSVQSKSHDDGHYVTSYSCNCHQSCSGSGSNRSCTQTCDTCYEDHYTRNWFLNTTIGNIITSNVDTTSRFRRDAFGSDKHWNDAYKGEACSKPNTYINYVAAADSSLHHREGTMEKWAKAGLLPDYPQIHGIYHLNRAHDLGVGIKNIGAWRTGLDNIMANLGSLKQINLFVYFVPSTDPSYKHALEAHWKGANKNDTIVLLGMEDDRKTVAWTDVITWAKSDLYRQTIIDGIMKAGPIQEDSHTADILGIINNATLKHYERRPMAEFEHLAKEISPPTWIMVILIIIAVPGSLALAYLFHCIDLDEVFRRGGRRGSFRRSSGIRIRRRRF